MSYGGVHNYGFGSCWCGNSHVATTGSWVWPSTTYTNYVTDCPRCPPQSPYVARHRA